MTTQPPSTDSSRVSYGRGGAGTHLSGPLPPSLLPLPPPSYNLKPTNPNPPGNIGRQPTESPAPDLVTPTIKSLTYTTGRGGTGNMAKNDPTNPAIARERQDVASLPRRMSEGESHFGRGGAANTIRPSAEEIARAREENARIEQALREKEAAGESHKGLADKGKGLLEKAGVRKEK
ncbi:hypothetical protein MMC16_005793 [Acarospora aff. strigata]|nr:hypothetical protein [Acarospora aff. strigata]